MAEVFVRGARPLDREGFWTVLEAPATAAGDRATVLSALVVNSSAEGAAVSLVVTDGEDQVLSHLASGIWLEGGQVRELLPSRLVLGPGEKIRAAADAPLRLSVCVSAMLLQAGTVYANALAMPALALAGALPAADAIAGIVLPPALELGLAVEAPAQASGVTLVLPALDLASSSGAGVSTGHISALPGPVDLWQRCNAPVDAGAGSTYVVPPELALSQVLPVGEVRLGARIESAAGVLAGAAPSPVIDAAAFDPYWDQVELLLLMEGANNGTVFTDSSSNAFTITRSGSPVTSTARYASGTSSAYFDGINSYLAAPSLTTASALRLDGDFTLELMLWYGTQTDSPVTIFEYGYVGGYDGLRLRVAGDESDLTVNQPASSSFVYYGAVGPLIPSRWYHLAVERASGVITVYLDGQPRCTAAVAATLPASDNSSLRLGSSRSNSSQDLVGYIDTVRLTKGVARYGGAFIPSWSFPALGPS